WTDFRILVCTALLLVGIPLRWSRRAMGIANPLLSQHARLNVEDRKYEVISTTLHPRSLILDPQSLGEWSACRPGSSRLETTPIVNVLSIEVGDYYHVTNFEDQVERRHWDQYPSRVVANTRRLLDMLDRHQIRATFFVLGWVGRRFPGLVREITRQGH